MATPVTSWHRAWGLTIASYIDLAPFLPAAVPAAESDITVVDANGSEDARSATASVRLAWQGLVVEVGGGRRVVVCDAGGARAGELAQFIAGPAMGAVLAQRGYSVLHASAVRLQGEVLAFTGRAGAGKSTLAVLLAEHGAEFLADDMLIVEVGDRGAAVVVGPRGAKVGRDAIPPAWSMVAGDVLDGRVLAVPDAATSGDGTRLSLGRLCVVGEGDVDGAPSVTPLRGAARLLAALEADFVAPLVHPDDRAVLLERAQRLAAAVPILALRRPRRLDIGGAVADALRDSRETRVPPPPLGVD